MTALPRRRPWKFAKEAATLDRLSGGRLVVGVGIGGTWDFLPFGEETAEPVRGRMLDEGLDVVTGLWRGAPMDHAGEHFTLRGAQITPSPCQRPRIPIWVAGYWPGARPFRRAARWDGVAPVRQGHTFEGLTPDELSDCVEYVRRHRQTDEPFDVVQFGTGRDWLGKHVSDYERAGATWWLEAAAPTGERPADFLERLRAGPPG